MIQDLSSYKEEGAGGLLVFDLSSTVKPSAFASEW